MIRNKKAWRRAGETARMAPPTWAKIRVPLDLNGRAKAIHLVTKGEHIKTLPATAANRRRIWRYIQRHQLQGWRTQDLAVYFLKRS